jgi:hypothetical protein
MMPAIHTATSEPDDRQATLVVGHDPVADAQILDSDLTGKRQDPCAFGEAWDRGGDGRQGPQLGCPSCSS